MLGAWAAVACRGDRGGDRVARAVADGVRAQLGVEVERIVCTRDRCDITLVGGVALTVTVTGDREVTWESDEVIRTAPVAARVGAELEDLGVVAAVDCGPALVAAAADAPTRVTCRLGDGGEAWVDVGLDGGVAVELALGAEAVRARTEVVDEAQLEQRSRMLDSDDAEGSDGDGDDHGDGDIDGGDASGPVDAGVGDAR